MNTGKTVFAQLIEFVPRHIFRKYVQHYHGNHRVRRFSCWDQFLCMVFAQLTYSESLRDLETCLRAIGCKLYHLGIRCRISRSTIADANDNRDWRIYRDLAYTLIARARKLYSQDEFELALGGTIYALDSTAIDLCLSLFPWAKFRRTKSAVKMHTLLDLKGNIPSFIVVSRGKVSDVKILDMIIFEPGAFYIMDRGYLDFARLYALNQSGAFFVIRAKRRMCFRRIDSRLIDIASGVRLDQTIKLTGVDSKNDYPGRLRRVKYFDAEKRRHFIFLTNNFTLSAQTIADLYKMRWRVELFFKWIKQHLRIKVFFGTSPNAVRTQIWIAISVYVLVAIVKKELRLSQSLYTILQIFSISALEKTYLEQLFNESECEQPGLPNANQLNLF